MQHFKTRSFPFPDEMRGQVFGFVKQYPDHCTIVIDSTQPAEQQAKTLRHELAHIALNHLDRATRSNLDEIEAEADKYAEGLTAEKLAELMQWQI